MPNKFVIGLVNDLPRVALGLVCFIYTQCHSVFANYILTRLNFAKIVQNWYALEKMAL